MEKRSAGILLFRRRGPEPEVLLVHPGGPFWARRDLAAWSIPKGRYAGDEDPLTAARREMQEETGLAVAGDFLDLGRFRQPGGKIIAAFALEGDFDPARLTSNLCSVEWPPRSGRRIEVPEVDRADWFTADVAIKKIHKGQAPIIGALQRRLAGEEAPDAL